MYTIKQEFINEIVISKSRFITYLNRVESLEEATLYINSIKKQHPKANHHCTAVLINNLIQSSNDDREPKNTAGIPMLEVLRKREMTKIVAVVVRYFGGVKLGAGGLIRAYGGSVTEALDNATIYQKRLKQKWKITVDYKFVEQLDYLLKDVSVLERDFQMQVTYTILNNDTTLNDKLMEITSGSSIIEFIKEIEIEVIVNEK